MTCVLALAVSCSSLRKTSDNDAGMVSVVTDTVDAAPVPAPALLAANQGDIARFPDETPIAATLNTAQRAFSVREAPPSGTIVGQLVKGTSVTQLASRGPYVLIVFEKTPGMQTMGWVHRDAFSASVVDAGTLTCAAGESPSFTDVPTCGKTCTADPECGPGQACKASANKLAAGNKAGEAVKVCTASIAHDAGAVSPAIDAGKPAIIDAGAMPVNAPVQDVVNSTGGKCPASYVLLAKTGKCHRPCPGGPSGKECKNQPFFCIKCNADLLCLENANQCR